MFDHLTSQFTGELQTVQKVLSISERLRDLLITQHHFLTGLPAVLPPEADDIAKATNALSRLIPEEPAKLDWQIYDHCAALTRIYAAYERFVSDLVAEYLGLLPGLYSKYSDLPYSITKQHRLGIGHILRKIGDKGPYEELDEELVVGKFATSLSGAPGYALIVDAFFIDRQNLRFDTLARLFGVLGFKHCARYINKHPAMTNFIRRERSEDSSAERELHDFIEYRNEAAHRKVENLLSKDEIGTTACFIGTLGIALADMVEEAILDRHMTLSHYSVILTISETHYNGHVVIGTPGQGVRLKIGDDIVIFGGNTCRAAVVEGIQLQGHESPDLICDGHTEVGLRISKPALKPGELRRLRVSEDWSKQIPLVLEDLPPVAIDAADTDVADLSEADAGSVADIDEQATTD